MIVALPVAKSELTVKAACELQMPDGNGRKSNNCKHINGMLVGGDILLNRPNNQSRQRLCTRQISLNSG